MSLDTRKSVETRLLGSSLVAAFHRATPPLIWRFDLERNHSFTLALQGEEGDWELGLASSRGEFSPIAHFAQQEDAEAAFVRVGQALAKANPAGRQGRGVFKGAMIVLVPVMILLIGAGVFLHQRKSAVEGNVAPLRQGYELPRGMVLPPATLSALRGAAAQMPAAPAPAPEAPAPEITGGVPLSADQFLRPPR